MAVFLTCSIALAQKVNVDWQRGNNFSRYTTYAWGTSPHPIQDPLWNQRIVDMINGQLTAKGLRQVSMSQNPSLVVVYSAGIQQNVSYEGYRMGWVDAVGSIQQVVQNEGTLIVSLADPQEKMVVWRGMSAETLSDKSTKNINKAEKMVAKMFKRYPPKD